MVPLRAQRGEGGDWRFDQARGYTPGGPTDSHARGQRTGQGMAAGVRSRRARHVPTLGSRRSVDPPQPVRPAQHDTRGDLDAVRGGRQAGRDAPGNFQRSGSAADGEKSVPRRGTKPARHGAPVRRVVPARGRGPADGRGRGHDHAATRSGGSAERHRGCPADHLHGPAAASGVRREGAGRFHETRAGCQGVRAVQRRPAHRPGSPNPPRGAAAGFAKIASVAERRVSVPVHQRVRRRRRVHRGAWTHG